jgi:hypothetical protein
MIKKSALYFESDKVAPNEKVFIESLLWRGKGPANHILKI